MNRNRFIYLVGLALVCFVAIISPVLYRPPSFLAKTSFSTYCEQTGELAQFTCDLAHAQKAKQLDEIERIIDRVTQMLGDRAGKPSPPDPFAPISGGSQGSPYLEVTNAFEPYRKAMEKDRWWRSRPQPTELEQAPRFLASIIMGVLAAQRAGVENSPQLLQIAEEVANYLLWTQKQGQQGLFPFPDARGKGKRLSKLVEEFLTIAERENMVSEVLVNGWIVNDLGDGGLQFDNGLCGVAMLELYEATGDNKYLESARSAADWAIGQPTVPNWNYNSFSIFLLANAYRVTGDRRYLESAKEKARLGLYPGQLKAGPNRGRWLDPHNARLVYHFFILRGLGALAAALPDADPSLEQALESLTLALQVSNREIIEKGVTSPDYALEVLSRLQLSLPKDSLSNTQTSEALKIVEDYTIAIFQQGKLPVPPASWGLFLENQTATVAK